MVQLNEIAGLQMSNEDIAKAIIGTQKSYLFSFPSPKELWEDIKGYLPKMTQCDFATSVDTSNILTAKSFDLTGLEYHGGTTLSSGALPKWDLLDKAYMVKRCTINSFGTPLSDAVNEELIYKFCSHLNIECAYYRTVCVKYFDDESNKEVECNATVTKIFDTPLTHYRDIRRKFNLGSVDDEIVEFTDKFKVATKLNDSFLVDFLFNQQDRHSKNIGMLGNDLSPIFDSGSCLFFEVFDEDLSRGLFSRVPRHKTFGRPLDELLRFSLKFVHPEFSFKFEENKIIEALNASLNSLKALYSKKRLEFIEGLIKRRVSDVRQILSAL